MGSVVLQGTTSGSTTLTPTDGVTATLTLPNATGTLLTSTGAISNLAGGSNGTIPYQSASNTTTMLATGTSGQLLQSNGNSAPSWVTVSTNQDYVVPVNLAYQNMSAIGYFNLGSISIPSAGDWRIYNHLRWGSGSYTGYLWIQLSNSSSSGGMFGYAKMQLEKLQATSSNLNIGLHSEFIVRLGTGCTFPYTIYVFAYQSTTGTLFLQNDSNGYNQLGATKLASTTSSANTAVQIGY